MLLFFATANPSCKQPAPSYPVTFGISHAKADKGKRDRVMIRGVRSFFMVIAN
ncbi:hypothetical protein [Moraxella lacunata]|uniref:hypothetical protein n=1 Tax=Moraxella lacunata TaxID=477 RepID=UPI003EE1F440